MPSSHADLTGLIKDLSAANAADITEPVLDQVADEVFTDQLAHVPVDTGALKAGHKIETRPGWRFIGPDHAATPYDVFVHGGTKPHTISAPPGGVLAFKVGGKQVFAKSVRHPGTRPQPWAANSMRRWHETLGDKMALVAVKQVMGDA